MKFADDLRPIVRTRPERVRHQVVGVQAEQQVRVDREVGRRADDLESLSPGKYARRRLPSMLIVSTPSRKPIAPPQ